MGIIKADSNRAHGLKVVAHLQLHNATGMFAAGESNRLRALTNQSVESLTYYFGHKPDGLAI